MARAVKVGSKRKVEQGPVPRSGESTWSNFSTEPEFTDTFLGGWIDDRLGTTENRPLLLLHISWPAVADTTRDGCDISTAIAAITSRSGYAIRRRGNQIIGVWGLQRCHPADLTRAISAAQTICNGVAWIDSVRCVLHATTVAITNGALEDSDDAVVLAFAGVLEGAQALASLPDAVVVTEPFKTMCGLQSGMLPVAVSGTRRERSASVLYALDYASSVASAQRGAPHTSSPLMIAARLDALGDLKPFVIAAAIVGNVFTLNLLAHLLGMERERLLAAIVAAKAIGLISEDPVLERVERYVFLDRELQRFAYSMVPPRERLRLHRRVAEALSQCPAESASSPPDQVARHHRIANNPIQSRRWLGKAAWQAVATDNAASAVAHLERALSQDHDSASVSASRRALLQLLGVQLAIAKGNGSDAVLDAYQRSLATSDQQPYLAWRQEVRSLWLAQSSHLVKGEVRAALTLGGLLFLHLQRHEGRSQRTLGKRIVVNRMYALTLMLSGQLNQALQYYDLVIRDYDAEHHARLRFAYGSDQLVLAHAHRVWTLALAGRAKEVPSAIAAARCASDRVNHPHTTAHAMSVIAIASLASCAFDEALFAAREARAIAAEYCFPYWVAWADVILAAVDAKEEPRTAYSRLEDAMSAYRGTGAAQLCPFIHGLLSAAALRTGQHELALHQAEAGLALMSHNGCILHRPKLLHDQARALFALDRTDEAEAALQSGYHDAHKSGAGLFKLLIARDGLKHTAEQQQISWQMRYHAAI